MLCSPLSAVGFWFMVGDRANIGFDNARKDLSINIPSDMKYFVCDTESVFQLYKCETLKSTNYDICKHQIYILFNELKPFDRKEKVLGKLQPNSYILLHVREFSKTV